MCPYFVVSGLPQTINESNDWVSTIINSCVAAIKNVFNEVVLNEFTAGISWDIKWNYILCINYLGGETRHISLPNNNQNIKNLRYQIIGGSYTAPFGCYVFDPWILKITEDVHKEVIWVKDYAYDMGIIILESLKVVKTLIALNASVRRNWEGIGVVTYQLYLYVFTLVKKKMSSWVIMCILRK